MTATTARTPFKLTQNTTFRRTDDEGWELQLELGVGKRVEIETVDIKGVPHCVAVYTDSDNNEWRTEPRKKTPKQQSESKPAPVPVVPPTPSAQTQAATQQTAKSATSALSAVAARQITATDTQERNVRKLERTVEMLKGKVYQVNYYIPSALSDSVDNPSRIFRRHGFRLDGSNWVFPHHGLDHKDVQKVLKEWDSMNVEVTADSETNASQSLLTAGTPRVRYWIIEYTEGQLAQMKELAQAQLADELRKTHMSLITRIDSAAQDLAAAQEELNNLPTATQRDRDKVDNAYNGRIRGAITEACERFEMCLKGAEIFDDTGDLDALFNACRDAIRTRALAANAMLQAKRVKKVVIPKSING